MSAEAREKAREHGQKSGKGNQTVSRALSAIGAGAAAAAVFAALRGKSDEGDDSDGDE